MSHVVASGEKPDDVRGSAERFFDLARTSHPGLGRLRSRIAGGRGECGGRSVHVCAVDNIADGAERCNGDAGLDRVLAHVVEGTAEEAGLQDLGGHGEGLRLAGGVDVAGFGRAVRVDRERAVGMPSQEHVLDHVERDGGFGGGGGGGGFVIEVGCSCSSHCSSPV